MRRTKPPKSKRQLPPGVSSISDARRRRREERKERREAEKQRASYSPPPRIGRPPKCSTAVTKEVCDKIRGGTYEWVACRSSGISVTSLHRWKNRGKELHAQLEKDPSMSIPIDEQPYLEFFVELEKAIAEARGSRECIVFETSPKFWLSRGPGRDMGPEQPGWTNRMEVSGPGGGAIQVSLEDLVESAASGK